VEDQGSGTGLAQELRRDGVRTVPIKPMGDKVMRMSLQLAAIEGGPAPESRPWSDVQPWAADDRAAALADLLRARAACGRADAPRAAWFTDRVGRPRAEIDPPPLVTGTDLLAAGVPAGRAVGAALARLRTMQLDGVITTREQALDAVRDG
jgi:hypothetical protein